VVQQVMV